MKNEIINNTLIKPSPADFMFGSTLGEGAYARVVHAKAKNTNEEYAVKIMEKRFIKKENKVKFVMMERKVFSKLQHERIVKLYFTFQDRNYLYMVMDLCRGGELLDVIIKNHNIMTKNGFKDKACSEEITQFYIAEIIQALEYLHENQIIHRDLKPENVLLTADGHIKLTDFGTAKDESVPTSNDNEQTEDSNDDNNGANNTFCGTAEYVSPEVLRDQVASRGCDLWAIGCMVYQMLVGRSLFRGENEYLTFQQILSHDSANFQYPEGFPIKAKDFINKLLVQDPEKRLGASKTEPSNNYNKLKSHSFFDGINWKTLSSTKAPYIPVIEALPPTENDGATEDWLFAGVATELQVTSGLIAEPLIPENGILPHTVSAVARQRAAQTKNQNNTNVRTNSLWNRFLRDNEYIRISSLISKRKGLFSRKRQLILTSTPRIIYIDPVRMRQKGEIPWSKQLYIQVKSYTSFDIVTPNRVYHLTDNVNGSQKWTDAINAELIRQR